MDILNKQHPHLNTKSTALKATTAAVLALSVDVAMATICPTSFSSSISGVCTITSGSVTVLNGGVVGGILSGEYIIDAITIDAGGKIANGTNTHAGIVTSGSQVSGGISNAGSISGDREGINIQARAGTSSVISSIVNASTGSITAASSNGVGIDIGHSTVTGVISNAGSIFGNSAGIFIHQTSIYGSVINSIVNASTGSITAASSNGVGIDIRDSTVTRGISNAGTISAGFGIELKVANVDSIVNATSGTIVAGAMNAVGIGVISTVSGVISNAGLISANGANGAGIKLLGGIIPTSEASVNSIINAGSIAASAMSGIGIGVLTNSLVTGGISNAGSISANGVNGVGIEVLNGQLTLQASVSSIANSGSIAADFYGIEVKGGTASVTSIVNESTGSIVVGNPSGVGIGVLSGASVTGGILNSGTIQGNGNAVFVSDNSHVDKLDLIGQNAHIIGGVVARNTTVNITQGARFTSEGKFDVKNFNIKSDAFFNMANLITTGKLDNSGTLFIANGTSPQSLAGNYIQQAGGLFQIGATNTSSYGQLVATNADLTASGAINVQLTQDASFHPGDVLLDVIKATGSLTPPTNGYSVTENSFIWKFSAITNATNGVNLVIDINPVAYAACAGTYCAGAANVIIGQVASGNTNFSPFAQLPTATDFSNAASQATPELLNENIHETQLTTQAVLDVLPMWSSLHGTSSGDAMLYQPGKVWLKPYASSMSQHQRTTVNGYRANAYGVVLGKDLPFADDWMFGGALAAGYDKIRGDSVLSGQSITTNAYQAILYTTKSMPHHTYFAGQGLVGVGFNDTQRTMPVFASSAKGSYNSWFTNLAAELGWNYAINQRLLFTPVVNASYIYIYQAGFTEKESSMNLNVQANNDNSLLLGADANVSYHAATSIYQQNLTLTGHVGIAYGLLNNQPSTIATFTAGGPAFSTYGIQYNDAVCRAGLGVSLDTPKKPFSLNLNYDLQEGNNGYSGLFSATLKYKA